MNGFIFLTMVLRADGTVTTNSGMHSKLYIVYLEIYVVPIGRGFSFFWSWKIKCWKRGGTLVTEDRFHGQQPIRLDKMIRFCPAMGEGGNFGSRYLWPYHLRYSNKFGMIIRLWEESFWRPTMLQPYGVGLWGSKICWNSLCTLVPLDLYEEDLAWHDN